MKQNFMNDLKLKFSLCFVLMILTLASKSQDTSYLSSWDSLKIIEKGADNIIVEVLAAKGQNTITLSYDGFQYQLKEFLGLLADFPELQGYAKANMLDDKGYLRCIANCYNSYKVETDKPMADARYFKSFGLNTEEERIKGPTKEMLLEKKAIELSLTYIKDFSFDQHNSVSGKRERFKAYFRYGDSSYYEVGSYCGNLKRALKNDKAAKRYIKYYRSIFLTKVGLGIVSVVTGILGIYYLSTAFSDSSNQGMGNDKEQFAAVILPFVSLFTMAPAYLIGSSYKENTIQQAVKLYNSKLIEEKQLKELKK